MSAEAPCEALVLGGGLAGLAAATRLAEAGVPVRLIEGRGGLGGRARSIVHRATGDEIDTGQHVLMGCYHEMLRFLERIGSRELVVLQDRLSVELAAPDGRRARLAGAALPAPLGLAVGLLRHGGLDWREKLGALRVVRAVRARAGDPALDRLTVAEWLAELGQGEAARRWLWDPITLACLNASADVAPASLLATVLARAFLGPGDASSIGLATVGLSSLHAERSIEFVERHGGRVELNAPARALLVEDGRCTGVVDREGHAVRARRVVAAVPGPALKRLLPSPWNERAPFATLDGLEPSPIVSAHLWLDRRVLHDPFLGVVDSPLHWVFDREATWGRPAEGGHLLTLVASGADELADADRDDVLALLRGELERVLPAAREARLLHWEVIKERGATFRARPGTEELRFGPGTPLPGLLVAGDWTDTGLPATMEGACASGHAAAATLLEAEGTQPPAPP